ncbi:subunit of the Arp2/3 complex, partial [Blyttiomyces sp. JEL0837]
DPNADDIVDEAIAYFRPNCFFRNFEINGGADRVLIYLLLFIQECIAKLAAKNPNLSEGTRLLTTHALQNFAIPGEASFPLNALYEKPATRTDAGPMSRAAPYRRICPEKVKARINQAVEQQFYVVQELGPMAFILREGETSDTPAKNIKVGLGSYQTCNCHTFLTENELCVHITLVRKSSEVSLTPSSNKANGVIRRPIEEGDVWNDFGSVESLKKEFTESTAHHAKVANYGKHYGIAYALFASEHSFRHRTLRNSKWVPSVRNVAPLIPPAMADDLQNRELGDGDYETLLQLDQPLSPQGDVPLHVINSFPTAVLIPGHYLLSERGHSDEPGDESLAMYRAAEYPTATEAPPGDLKYGYRG